MHWVVAPPLVIENLILIVSNVLNGLLYVRVIFVREIPPTAVCGSMVEVGTLK
jgi:hypothetical protein